MEKAWLQALSTMTYGIYVLTSFYKKEINGMIASWVSQISYSPPMIMAAIHPNRYSHLLIEKSGCFALNILSRDQISLLSRFKGPAPASKFDSINWVRGILGCPILESCIAYMECEVTCSYQPGNHTLFIGQVKGAQVFSKDTPLSTLDYEGVYLGKE